MEHVVYLLGAGFSAPLGLPVMRDFLVKSKDMYAKDAGKWAHFATVFEQIRGLTVAKNYYHTDLFNIEEILSLLEIRAYVRGNGLTEQFRQYIADVVDYYTPGFEKPASLPSNWPGLIFGKDPHWRGYGYFVTNLLNQKITRDQSSPIGIKCARFPDHRVRYSVLTLNYDLILETLAAYLNRGREGDDPIRFNRDPEDNGWTPLMKLHGSGDDGGIVPPTWSKGTHPEILPVWRRALTLLESANQIRIIGYSLPAADAYVRYLFKAGALHAANLKRIDVLCLDPDGTVRSRYQDFVDFYAYRFKNESVTAYFDRLLEISFKGWNGIGNWWATLEPTHESFFAQTREPAMSLNSSNANGA